MAESGGLPVVDLARAYEVAPGVPVLLRGEREVQIGTDGATALVLRRAPQATGAIVADLDGRRALGDVLRSHDADPAVWVAVLGGLLAAGLIVAVDPGPPSRDRRASRAAHSRLIADRMALTERIGPPAAERAMTARLEATVVVRGAGRVAGWIAGLLAAGGVGHVHQEPDRDVRPDDLTTREGPPVRANQANALAARIRGFAPHVHTHRPANPMHVTVQVLAGDGPAEPGLAAQLTRQGVPHLQAWAGPTRAVVGPLVLPGRTSCLNCAQLFRTGRDPHWPSVAAAMRARAVPPPTTTAVAVASLAVAQLLDFVDGVGRPATIDGTFDWPGWGAPRRRSWQQHPDCDCH